MNEKTPGFCFSGFLIMMLMPSCMNGLLKSITAGTLIGSHSVLRLKSITRSRTDVIVNGATAMSATCSEIK